jgi:endonuclease/exonuclease/phosphatase (EEP) superfamily protein YafD
MILAGDFNEVPWSAAMRRLEDDIRPLRRITRAALSYPALIDEREWPLPLLPIDHIFVGPGIAVESVRILPATGSDHLPILAELALGSDAVR